MKHKKNAVNFNRFVLFTGNFKYFSLLIAYSLNESYDIEVQTKKVNQATDTLMVFRKLINFK